MRIHSQLAMAPLLVQLAMHTVAPTLAAAAATAAAHGGRPAGLPGLQVANLRTEYLANPLGLDKAAPRFTWELHAEDTTVRGLAQASYRLKVGANGAADGSVWDSSVVRSARSFQVKYAGPALASGTVYTWAVTVRTSAGAERTSASALFSTGMLTRAAWGAGGPPRPPAFIGVPAGAQLDNATCPWFRTTFHLPAAGGAAAAAGTSGARVQQDGLMYVASIGYHELFVNGHAASEAVLLPSVSYLPKRLLYRTYNVSGLLRPGEENVVGIWAAPGWAEVRQRRRRHEYRRVPRRYTYNVPDNSAYTSQYTYNSAYTILVPSTHYCGSQKQTCRLCTAPSGMVTAAGAHAHAALRHHSIRTSTTTILALHRWCWRDYR